MSCVYRLSFHSLVLFISYLLPSLHALARYRLNWYRLISFYPLLFRRYTKKREKTTYTPSQDQNEKQIRTGKISGRIEKKKTLLKNNDIYLVLAYPLSWDSKKKEVGFQFLFFRVPKAIHTLLLLPYYTILLQSCFVVFSYPVRWLPFICLPWFPCYNFVALKKNLSRIKNQDGRN